MRHPIKKGIVTSADIEKLSDLENRLQIMEQAKIKNDDWMAEYMELSNRHYSLNEYIQHNSK